MKTKETKILDYCSNQKLNKILKKVTEEKLYDAYIVRDLDRKDVCNELGISNHELCILLDYHKLKKDMSTRMRKTRARQLKNLTPEKAKAIKEKELATKAAKSPEEKQKIKAKELATKEYLKKTDPEKYYSIQAKRNKTRSETLKNKPAEFWENKHKKFLESIKKVSASMVENCIKTKYRNNSFNKSVEEIFVVNYLKDNYNIETQYRCERYPFLCDIYVKDLDLFIEINGHWTHGKHPFDNSNIEDIKLLETIRSKQNCYTDKNGHKKKNTYFVFEKVWTQTDPLKLKFAKTNKLNYIALYNINESNMQNIYQWDLKEFHGVNILDMSSCSLMK